jgi:DNA-binding response OmpR family regulator
MQMIEKLQILLVEDSVLMATQLRELIGASAADASVVIATGQDDALRKLGNFTPDIVILDLLLKEGSGFSLLRELVARSPRPSIVVLTNYALPKYRDYSLLIGADYFLDKATSIESLPSIIEAIARRR